MSNKPHIKTLNRTSGQMSRPKADWKGWRPPWSAKRRYQAEQFWKALLSGNLGRRLSWQKGALPGRGRAR